MNKYFETVDGIHIPAVPTEQMIEIDRIAIEETRPNLYQMMENAGRNLTLTIIDNISKILNPTILILSGSGGNGGGGICAARHLANRNYNVKLAVTEISKLRDVPKKQLEVYHNAGGKVIDDLEGIKADIIVDAIIGYSLSNAPRGTSLEFIKWANSHDLQKISLDIPSGIEATTGENYGEYFHTDSTLTLALPKTGLTELKCGKLLLGDIGIPKIVYYQIGLDYQSPFKNEFVDELNYK